MAMLCSLAFVFALALNGHTSQPPTPSAVKEHGHKRDAQGECVQPQTPPNLQGTEALPIWVKVSNTGYEKPPGDSNENKGKDGPTSHWWGDPNWWVAAFTLLLAVIAIGQVILFGIQLWIMRSSLKDSKTAAVAAGKAADAAQRSADIATNTERAWLTAEVTFASNLPDIAKQGGPERSAMIVEFENAGRSPAEIVRTQVVSFVYPANWDLPETPTYGDLEEMFEVHAMPGEIIPAGEKRMILSPIQQIALMSPEEKTEVMNGTKKLYCYGRIEYKDLSGTQRTTQFGFFFYVRASKSDNRPEAMYRFKSRAYNYTN